MGEQVWEREMCTPKHVVPRKCATNHRLRSSLQNDVGEYVSVSSQRDSEKALLEKEHQELIDSPEAELQELTTIYEKKGLSKGTAEAVAKELTAHDAFAAHVDAELGIDPNELTNPWHAAYASALAFFCGGIVPLIVIVLLPSSVRILLTFAAVFIALIVIGVLSAKAGKANKTTATIRVVIGGILAMIVTFGIGKIFGVVGI
jgi:VIT1/CCC1 family predicted Fe2+/Mn2+ transporter